MLLKLFQRLENPERPLIGPNYYWLQFWGLLLPDKKITQYLYIFMHLMVFLFIFTEFVDIWFMRADLVGVLTNVKITFISTVNVFKVSTFILWQDYWKEVLDYATKADLKYRKENRKENNVIIDKYTVYSRKITYYYWILTFITVIAICIQPFFKLITVSSYRENVRNGTEVLTQIINTWVPWDKNTPWGYFWASFYMSYSTFIAGGWITSLDTNSIVLMIFFGGQMELLRCKCRRIYGDEVIVSDEEARERIIECHLLHVELMKHAKLFNSLISPVMLLYMIVCSVMICASAVQIILEPGPMQRFLTTEYLVFGIAQLFNYCWHSNEVLYKSQDVHRGPFESLWWASKTGHGKDLVLLTGQLNSTVVFRAGPFMTLTVTTFVSILKAAYSYYTLLRRMD